MSGAGWSSGAEWSSGPTSSAAGWSSSSHSAGAQWGAATVGSGPFQPAPIGPSSGGASGLKIGLIIVGVIGALIIAAVGWFVWAVSSSVPGGLDTLTGDLLPGHTYGDNADLDVLWDRCAAGEYGACDELFFVSEVGSDYEFFGDSCGRRNEPAGLCTTIYGG